MTRQAAEGTRMIGLGKALNEMDAPGMGEDREHLLDIAMKWNAGAFLSNN